MAQAFKPINNSGLQLRPFYAYKRWNISSHDFRTEKHKISILRASAPEYNENITVSKSIGGVLSVDNSQLRNSTTGSTQFLANKFQKSVWTSLKNTFYNNNIDGELYATASVFSIPQNRMGDGIKPGSFKGVDYSLNDNSQNIITSFSDYKIDEYHGYIVDDDIKFQSLVGRSNLLGYWGFNENYLSSVFNYKIKDKSKFNHKTIGCDITYSNGITTELSQSLNKIPTGIKADFNGETSYIKIENNSKFDLFKDTDYSISLWTDLPAQQKVTGSNYNWIITKSGTTTDQNITTNQSNPIYPFDIKIANQNTSDNGKVIVSISDGLNTTEITSITSINNGLHHITFNKNKTQLQLYIDGAIQGTLPLNIAHNISNENDILIGSKFATDVLLDNNNYGSISGSIDEVRIYKKYLSDIDIKSLIDNDFKNGTAYQTPIIGQIFYNHGIAVITDPRPKYQNIWLGPSGSWDYDLQSNVTSSGFTTEYKSTKLIHETAVLCEIGADEFNVSTNPTLRVDNNIKSTQLKSFVTGSDFRTYITTIGLYNNVGDLIAIGKLASPIQNRDDVDITIKVRFDLDGPFGTPNFITKPEENPITLVEDNDGYFVWNKTDIPDVN